MIKFLQVNILNGATNLYAIFAISIFQHFAIFIYFLKKLGNWTFNKFDYPKLITAKMYKRSNIYYNLLVWVCIRA